jgi:hypothetical protein
MDARKEFFGLFKKKLLLHGDTALTGRVIAAAKKKTLLFNSSMCYG